MKPTIVFATRKRFNFLSATIRWFTGSPASHVLIGLEWLGVPVFVHATIGGVVVSPRKKFLKSSRIVQEFRVLPNVDVNVVRMLCRLDEDYDYPALLGYGLLIAARRLFRVKMKNPFASSRGVVCSEFVVNLRHGGIIPEWCDLDPESSTPADLLDRCKKGDSFGVVQ